MPAPIPSGSPDPTASPTPSPSAGQTPTAAGAADETLLFAVDLFSAEESNIRPGDGARIASLGSDTPSDPATAGVARDEFWPLLVALTLVFLVAEWLVYERDGARRLLQGVRQGVRRLRPA